MALFCSWHAGISIISNVLRAGVRRATAARLVGRDLSIKSIDSTAGCAS